jgi:hypothetical protein
VIERRYRGGSGWGAIKVGKARLRVDDVDLRHLLESAVLQANADVRDDTEETMTPASPVSAVRPTRR